MPVLVLVGEEDFLTPPEEARAILGGLIASPARTYRSIPESGHLPPLERPDAFREALAGFLEEQLRS